MLLCDLPLPAAQALSAILDVDDGWEEVAGEMGDAARLVLLLRGAAGRRLSPTQELLRVYAAKGHPVDNLARLLARLRHRTALQVLQEHVEPRLFDKLRRHCEASGGGESWRASQRKASERGLTEGGGGALASAGSWRGQTAGSSASATSSASSSAGLSNTLAVPYEEIRKATEDFAPERLVGKGGYGRVYKAQWQFNTVAVKRIGGPGTGGRGGSDTAEKERLRQSVAELRTLGFYRHDHVLPLYGYSLDGPEPLLVYQFMEQGSLEDRLLLRGGSEALSWAARRSAVLGAAKGIHFLHDAKPEPLIHGDVKSANILLDRHLSAKLGDFGLCRHGRVSGSDAEPLIVSHIKGTLAYLPPEFLRSKHLSTKLDVFSFGVVLLEVVTGQRAYSERRKPENLVTLVREGRAAEAEDALFDPKAPPPQGAEERDTAHQLLVHGLAATDHQPSLRPPVHTFLQQFLAQD